jgi:DNA-binding transcriptional ArsR family regulator
MLDNINPEQLENTAEIFRAVSHPLRLKILEFIDKSKSVNVNKIYDALDLEQSITSQHLKILRLANLVQAVRTGKNIFYEVNYEMLAQIQSATNTYLKIS